MIDYWVLISFILSPLSSHIMHFCTPKRTLWMFSFIDFYNELTSTSLKGRFLVNCWSISLIRNSLTLKVSLWQGCEIIWHLHSLACSKIFTGLCLNDTRTAVKCWNRRVTFWLLWCAAQSLKYEYLIRW